MYRRYRLCYPPHVFERNVSKPLTKFSPRADLLLRLSHTNRYAFLVYRFHTVNKESPIIATAKRKKELSV